MGLLITDEDFVGKWKLTLSNNDDIDSYIEEYEEKYLIELLGKELFDLFKNDVDSGTMKPLTPIYESIYNPFSLKINGCVITSDGMKKMLLGLIYFQYVRDNAVKQTMNGAVNQQTEVSTRSDNTFLYGYQNTAVKTYKAIQYYIINNSSDYPTFYGINKKFSSFI